MLIIPYFIALLRDYLTLEPIAIKNKIYLLL